MEGLNTMKILIIEDRVSIQELLRFNMEKEGYTVVTAGDGKEGLAMVKSEKPDLIILDLMLPILNGFEVCKTLRATKVTSSIPIIIMSASNDVKDKVIGLELGADDYITKPFNPRELTARIKARLREELRRNEIHRDPLKWGELEIIPKSYIATVAGQPLSLTIKEFDLLALFVANPYQVFSHEYLTQKVWGCQTNVDTRMIDVHVRILRSKLKVLGPVIDSVRGVGYRFTVDNK
jgi:two-component system alkaline phosphatase synthesis response regulator PhoP